MLCYAMISLCVGGLLMKEIATKTQDEKTPYNSKVVNKSKKALKKHSGYFQGE